MSFMSNVGWNGWHLDVYLKSILLEVKNLLLFDGYPVRANLQVYKGITFSSSLVKVQQKF